MAVSSKGWRIRLQYIMLLASASFPMFCVKCLRFPLRVVVHGPPTENKRLQGSSTERLSLSILPYHDPSTNSLQNSLYSVCPIFLSLGFSPRSFFVILSPLRRALRRLVSCGAFCTTASAPPPPSPHHLQNSSRGVRQQERGLIYMLQHAFLGFWHCCCRR